MKDKKMTRENASKYNEFFDSIDDCIDTLMEYKKYGISIYVNFKGHKLYSCDATPESVYKEVVGDTKTGLEDDIAFINKYLTEYPNMTTDPTAFWNIMDRKMAGIKEKLANTRQSAYDKLPYWMSKLAVNLNIEKRQEWARYQERATTNPMYALAIDNVIEILDEKKEKGFEGAFSAFISQGHGNGSEEMIYEILEKYIKDGNGLKEYLMARFENYNDLISRSEMLVSKDKQNEWVQEVKEGASNPTKGLTVSLTIELMEAIDKDGIETAYKNFYEGKYDKNVYAEILNTLEEYSDKGKEFVKYSKEQDSEKE